MDEVGKNDSLKNKIRDMHAAVVEVARLKTEVHRSEA
jgi:hypothetical protein